jgi:predicted dehydrogenase
MNKVRLGIVGMGNAGIGHARALADGAVPRIELSAVCDPKPDRCEPFPQARYFASVGELIRDGGIGALLIATPHFSHSTIGIAALEAGLHVLMEKPISVHKAEAARLIDVWQAREGRQVFAAMLNQRTDPCYRRIRELVQSRAFGQVRRLNWTVTNWFRPAIYYASGGWRATWAGEGGGVLLNQAPHNLDLLQWIFGLPRRVRAFCGLGRYHDIEVEDDVTAYLEFPNGATGVFITSTGEAPGTNRLEIAADGGRLVYENDRLTIVRNAQPMGEFCRTATAPFSAPATTEETIRFEGRGGQHSEVLGNFADAIIDRAPLIAPASEGIHSVELANAMLLSSWSGTTVDLPIDAAAYARELEARIATSRFVCR